MAGILGALFSAAVLRQYAARRKPHQLAWGVALAMFAIAALFEVSGIRFGWSGVTYKGYYLFGAVLNVGWLGVGTLQLLAPKRVGQVGSTAMALITVFAIPSVLFISNTDPALLAAPIPGPGAIGPPATYFAPLINIPGSVLLAGGAVWSAFTAYRRWGDAGRVLGTVLIAAGALVVTVTHSLARVKGVYAVQPAGEALGIAIMFAGYLSVEVLRRPLRRPRGAV